jgi:hypothetical protein
MDIKAAISSVKTVASKGRRSKGALAIRYVEIPVAHWPKFQEAAEKLGLKGVLTAPLMRQVIYGVFDLGGLIEEAEKIVTASKTTE